MPSGVTGVGLVGVGAIGRVHLEVLRDERQDAFVLRAAADRVHAALPLDVDLLHSHHDLLHRQDISLITIATPPDSHYEIAADALRAGKHVLLEKPPTLTVQQARELEHLAGQRGLCVHTAMHARFGPAARHALALLATEQVQDVEVLYREDVAAYHGKSSWVFDARRSGGGVVMDSGINALSIVTAAVQAGTYRVDEARLSFPSDASVETRAHVVLSHDRGGRIRLDLDWQAEPPEVRLLTFRTSSGSRLRLDLVEQSLQVDDEVVLRGDVARSQVDQHEEYLAVYGDLAARLAEARGDIGRVELALVTDIYAAHARSGGVVAT